ncbi:hypothetical protein [Dyella thiooxydans]|uniref:hypothetical protein n=1 Tax=Dyella thiooxydans TaxID=445710 RepID=UPI0012FCBE84|nr:hypothetical protein [Dyella thiooxydans]
MNVSSVGSNFPAPATSRPESAEAAGVADHDGDQDDGGAAAAAAAPTPQASVNLSGQAVGRLLNVKA